MFLVKKPKTLPIFVYINFLDTEKYGKNIS